MYYKYTEHGQYTTQKKLYNCSSVLEVAVIALNMPM